MQESWQPKPADKVFRPRRIKRYRLKRVLGIPAVFSAGYGNVGSSIYYALGIVALAAMGATPLALGIAGVLFVFTALTYAEGTAMLPEAGGSASFARHGFNDLVGFVAGWALMLSYIVTISISAYTIPPYLGYFWELFKESPVIGTGISMGIVVFLMVLNVIGIRETSFVNITSAIIDIATQLSLIIIGFVLVFNPVLLVRRILENWPTAGNLILGIALASIAYTGIETMSQMAGETRQPEKRVPRALVLMIVTVLVIFAGISLVSLSVMTPQALASEWSRDPVAGIAANLPLAWLSAVFKPLIAVLAGTILLVATNAGIIGISRLAFSLGSLGLVPATLGRVHPWFKTPYVSIILFSVVGVILMVPGFFAATDVFENMGALYAFGSLLSFMFAHASILVLRARKPELPRPFKIRGNLKIRGREIPLTALLGGVGVFVVWLVILVTQPYSRWAGLAWMVIGLFVYYGFRRRRRISLPQEGALTEKEERASDKNNL